MKTRGRPPLSANDPSVSVHVKLPAREYDATYQRAQRARVSVPELIRRDMRRVTMQRRPKGP